MKEDELLVEAILFAAGTRISVQRICELSNLKQNRVIDILQMLEEKYQEDDTAIFLTTMGDDWKLTVKDKYLDIAQKIAPDTELSRNIIETLAILAWKAPLLQSDLVRLKSVKVYDHIAELKSRGFVTKEKIGRSFVLKLTPKFYEYFDIESKKDVEKVFEKFSKADLLEQKPLDEFTPQEQEELRLLAEEEQKRFTPKEVVDDAADVEEKTLEQIKAEEKATQKEFFDKIQGGLDDAKKKSSQVIEEFAELAKKDQEQAEENPDEESKKEEE